LVTTESVPLKPGGQREEEAEDEEVEPALEVLLEEDEVEEFDEEELEEDEPDEEEWGQGSDLLVPSSATIMVQRNWAGEPRS